MSTVLLYLSLVPVMRGLVAMLVSGAVFPLCGVMVLRLDLVPMRYMLMHGVILGGAVAMAMNLPLIPCTAAINIILVLFMLFINKGSSYGFNGSSAASMVVSMALASVIMHVKDVPAKDTLSLLWGSPFALSRLDLAVLGCLCLILIFYIVLNFRNIITLFYNREIAASLGINVKANYTVMVFMIALTVALCMKLLGAFLIDAFLILPVLIASSLMKLTSRSGMKRLFALSSASGLLVSAFGYLGSLALNLPPSASIALCAGVFYLLLVVADSMKKAVRKNEGPINGRKGY